MYAMLLTSLLLRGIVATSTDDDIAARTLHWANHPNLDSTYDYTLALTIRDVNHTIPDKYLPRVPVDTGSVGFLVSACELGYTDTSQIAHYPCAVEYLSSSGFCYKGNWVPKEVTFTSKHGTELRSRTPVFAVTETGDCGDTWQGNCTKSKPHEIICNSGHTGPKYLGIGFARWHPLQPNATASKNVMLNMNLSAFGHINQGYKIGRSGLVLGVRDTDLDGGYKSLNLTRNMNVSDEVEWDPVPSCVRVADGTCYNGTALFDTGLNYSILAVNETVTQGHEGECPLKNARECLKKGTSVSVFIGRKDNYLTHYSYNASEFDNNPQLSPVETDLEGHDHNGSSYINTGRYFFNGHDMIFDAKRGVVGLNWTGDDARIPSQWYNMYQQPMLKMDL